MDLLQKNSALYDRVLKTVALHARVSISAAGIAVVDAGSAFAAATETLDSISTELDETLSPAPSDADGQLAVALKMAELNDSLDRVLSASVIAASSAFGTVAVTTSITANGNLIVYLNSNQDITGDAGTIDLKLELLFK